MYTVVDVGILAKAVIELAMPSRHRMKHTTNTKAQKTLHIYRQRFLSLSQMCLTPWVVVALTYSLIILHIALFSSLIFDDAMFTTCTIDSYIGVFYNYKETNYITIGNHTIKVSYDSESRSKWIYKYGKVVIHKSRHIYET